MAISLALLQVALFVQAGTPATEFSRDFLTLDLPQQLRLEEVSSSPLIRKLARNGPGKWTRRDLEALDHEIEAAPNDLPLRVARAELVASLGLLKSRLKAIGDAERQYHFGGHYDQVEKGLMLARLGKLLEAEHYLMLPQGSWAWEEKVLRAGFEFYTEDLQGFRKTTREILKERPKSLSARLMRARSLLSHEIQSLEYNRNTNKLEESHDPDALGNPKLGLKIMDALEREYPQNPCVVFYTGLAAYSAGDKARYVSEFHKYLAMGEGGKIGTSRLGLANSYLKKGKG